ncbi:Replication factor C subunit 1, partial [Fragariocoptes setiger]
MWVDQYKPKSSAQIMGQGQNITRLKEWLRKAPNNRFKAVLLSGPPGIGKTTTAQLVCKELGFSYIEFNASDTRSKKELDDKLTVILKNSTLNFRKNCLIMDEVDGMSGNEDRGGTAQLIQLIKTSKIPIICICNDVSSPKVRSLANYCEHFVFQKPRKEQVRGVVMSIATKEGLQIEQSALFDLIESCNCDIRQVINYMSLFKKPQDSSEYALKTVKLSTFDATRKAFVGCTNIHDRFEMFFTDYGIMPLFIFENYLNAKPEGYKDILRGACQAIDSMCLGDIIDKEIRTNQSWSMLPTQALYSTAIPTHLMSCNHMAGRIGFPTLMGKISNVGKRLRLVQDLANHMSLVTRCGRDSLVLEYLDTLSERLGTPLLTRGIDAVPEVLEFFKTYSLRREDMDIIMELTQWPDVPNPIYRLDSKVKAALTRAYTKADFILPYAVEEKKAAKRRINVNLDLDDGIDEEDEEEPEEDQPQPKKRKMNDEKAKAVPKKGVSKRASKKEVEKPTKKETEQAEIKKETEKSTKKDPEAASKKGAEKTSKKESAKLSKKESAKSGNSTTAPAATKPPLSDIRRFFVK